MESETTEIGKRGTVVIPSGLRRKHGFEEGEDKQSHLRKSRQSSIWPVIIITFSIFAIETLSHTITNFLWPMSGLAESVVDSLLLVALISPVLYFFVLRPLNRSLAESVRAQEAMSKLAAIVTSSDDAILSANLDGIILSWNPGAERMYGYSAAEIEGRPASILVPPDRPHEIPHILETVRRGDHVDRYETIRVRKDGKQIHVSITASPIRDDRGRAIGISAIVRDITERKQALEEIQRRTMELEAVNKELEAFSYSASHDLRNPLIAIGGLTRVLLEDYSSRVDEKGKELLRMISRKMDLMRQLIDDLLAFSRSGRQSLMESAIDMNELTNSVIEEIRLLEGGRVFQFVLGPLPPARGDRAMIRQVLMNLLSNAVKFTRPKPTAVIEIGGKAEEGANSYYIRDNGVGFDMADVPKLFEVFKRLHHPREFEGTGVGLAIVQRIVQRHGGRAWAEGKQGEGATFHFSLPR